jgi:hypothetical protein
MRTCAGCGAELTKRTQLIYCAVSCQQRQRQQTAVERWLSTGVAVPGTHRFHYVRRHISEEQDYCCDICGRADEWEGQPLSFVLDHVDGDASNNHRDNLRLVCPNCDSQLPTYNSRNRGRGRHLRRASAGDVHRRPHPLRD